MNSALKGLLAGLLIGLVASFLVHRLAARADRDVAERIADALQCPAPIPQTAAAAHHAYDGPYGYSWFAATHADQIAYAGCELGPGAMYLHFNSGIRLSHVLATLRHFRVVCVADHGIFDGSALDGRAQLEDLCEEVDGRLTTLHRQRELKNAARRG